MCYLFIRLHHTLTLRLAEARRLASCYGSHSDKATLKSKMKPPGSRYLSSLSPATDTEDLDDETDLLTLGAGAAAASATPAGYSPPLSLLSSPVPFSLCVISAPDRDRSVYASYLSQLYSFIDGSLDPSKYPSPLLFPSAPLPDPSLWSCPALWDGQVRRQHTEHSRKPFLPSLHHRQGYPSPPLPYPLPFYLPLFPTLSCFSPLCRSCNRVLNVSRRSPQMTSLIASWASSFTTTFPPQPTPPPPLSPPLLELGQEL
jgi:hypothetical protein